MAKGQVAAAPRPPSRPILLLVTAASWVLLAGICGVQYLSGQPQVLSVKCQGALLLQPQAVAGAAAAAAAQALPQRAAQAPAPAKQKLRTSGGDQQQQQHEAAGEQQQQPQQTAAGGDGGGTSSGSGGSSRGGGSSSDRLPESWQEVDALIQAPSPLHGPQQKGGLPNRWAAAAVAAAGVVLLRVLPHFGNIEWAEHPIACCYFRRTAGKDSFYFPRSPLPQLAGPHGPDPALIIAR